MKAFDHHDYREILHRIAGSRSAAKLSNRELRRVVAEFRRLGWSPQTATGKKPSKNPQARLIWALWYEMAEQGLLRAPSRGALRTFIQNKVGVSDPDWLSPEQARAVIEALRAWQRRELRKAAK